MIIERNLFKNGGICNKGSIELKKIEDLDKLEKDLLLSKDKEYSYKNWTIDTNNNYYYSKRLENYNDFIGEELANILNLKSAHYEVGKINNEFVVASKNFNINKTKYLNAFDLIKQEDLYKSDLEKLKYLENKYGKSLILDFLKMTSLDILSRQIDRVPSNYAFEMKENNLRLAPLYDYSFAFSDIKNYKYLNYILSLDFTSNDIKKRVFNIINIYPEFYEYLNIMNNVDLSNLVNKIIEKNNFNYNKILKEKYDIENETSHKMLKKIL